MIHLLKVSIMLSFVHHISSFPSSFGGRSTCWPCSPWSWLSSALRCTLDTSATTGSWSGWQSSAAWRASVWFLPATGSGWVKASHLRSCRWREKRKRKQHCKEASYNKNCNFKMEILNLFNLAAVPASCDCDVPDSWIRVPVLRHQNSWAIFSWWALLLFPCSYVQKGMTFSSLIRTSVTLIHQINYSNLNGVSLFSQNLNLFK